MDKKFITLNELQHYVNFKGKNKNEKVKTFLNNVFEIGFSLKYSDIFSMEDFEYGDLLVLDYEFLYNEYLKFLNKNEAYDDVLFYIAEFEYANFYENIQFTLKNIKNFTSHFKTRKQLIEEEKEKKRQAELRKKEEEERKKNLDKLENNIGEINHSIDLETKIADLNYSEKGFADTMRFMINPSTPPESFEEKVFRLMNVKINDVLQANIFARIRIEEHLKNIKKVKEDMGSLFNS